MSDPTALAEKVSLAGTIALFGGTLYVASREGAAVLAVDTNGGGARGIGETLSSGYYTNSVAADASGVFWSQGAALQYAPLGGGNPVTLLEGTDAWHLALDTMYVYFVIHEGPPYGAKRIARIAKTGGPMEEVSTALEASGLAVAPNGIYFSDRDTRVLDADAVYFVPFGGGPRVAIAVGEGRPGLLAWDPLAVYWLNTGPQALRSRPTNANTAATLYTPPLRSTPVGIALDSDDVYISDYDSGKVTRVAKTGGPATTVAEGPVGAGGIVVDTNYVYWVIAGLRCGRVLRMHK